MANYENVNFGLLLLWEQKVLQQLTPTSKKQACLCSRQDIFFSSYLTNSCSLSLSLSEHVTNRALTLGPNIADQTPRFGVSLSGTTRLLIRSALACFMYVWLANQTHTFVLAYMWVWKDVCLQQRPGCVKECHECRTLNPLLKSGWRSQLKDCH